MSSVQIDTYTIIDGTGKPIEVALMDVFEKDGTFYLSEINPRFGGGFPHAYACGVDTPSYILRNLQEKPNESHWQEEREEIYVLKYSDILCVDC